MPKAITKVTVWDPPIASILHYNYVKKFRQKVEITMDRLWWSRGWFTELSTVFVVIIIDFLRYWFLITGYFISHIMDSTEIDQTRHVDIALPFILSADWKLDACECHLQQGNTDHLLSIKTSAVVARQTCCVHL